MNRRSAVGEAFNHPGNKHSSRVGLPLLAVNKNKKRHLLAHLILFLNVQRDIFNKCHKLQPSLVIRWTYQLYILAVEVKNSAKATLLSFNATAVFLHDVMVSENDVLEAGNTVDMFTWLT